MAKQTTPRFVLSVLSLALAACGQSVTDINSRGDGRLVKPGDESGADEDAGAVETISDSAATGAVDTTSQVSTPGAVVDPAAGTTQTSDAGPTMLSDAGTTSEADAAVEFVDPRPEKPGRGVVPAGAIEETPANCCSRVSGEPVSQFCPVGQGKTTFGKLAEATDKLQVSGTLATVGVAFEISLVTPLSEPLEFAVEETSIEPPAGIGDLSPVFWVWTAEDEDIPLSVRLPIAYTGFSAQAGAVHIFFSPDGAEFFQLADDYLNAGFLQGTLPGPGFVVAGFADASGIQCF